MSRNRRSRIRLIRWLFAYTSAVLIAVLMASSALPVHAEDVGRKIRRKVQPEYPDLAKKHGVRGSVRLELQISADGHVKNIKVLGGSPVLVQASVDAAEKWLFEPEPQASVMIVKFDFAAQ